MNQPPPVVPPDPATQQGQPQPMANMAPQQTPQMPQALPQLGQAPPSQVTIDDVVELLRSRRMRSFKIDVETDSLIEAHEQQEKQRRTEFVQAVGEFLGKMGPMVKEIPPLAPMVGGMLQFAVRGFRVGSELEELIETTMQKAGLMLMNPPPPSPDPGEQAKLQATQIKAQAEIQKAQIGAQSAQVDAQMKMQTSALQAQQAQADHQHAMAEHHGKMQQMNTQAAIDQQAQQMQLAQQQQQFAQQQAQPQPGPDGQ